MPPRFSVIANKNLHKSKTLKSNQDERKLFGFSRNIILTGLVSFLTDTSTKMVYSVMPMFLMSMGASKTTLSVIEGIAESTASLLKALSGFWSDKIGKNKPFMIIGYGLSAVIMPLFSFVKSPFQVLILRFTERIGKGIRTAPRDSLIAGSVTNGETGKSFGLQKALDNSGAIVGPLLAFGLLYWFQNNYQLIFLVSGIPALFGLALIVFGIREAKRGNKPLFRSFEIKHFPKRYYLFLLIVFFFTLGNSTDALLMVKANETGIGIMFIPLVYLLTNVISVIFSIPIGILSDKAGKVKVVIIGYLIYAIVYWGFGASSNISVIIGLFALYGLYSAATDGVQKAMISDMTDSNKQGTAMGIYNMLTGITLLPASIIAGLMYEHLNSSIPFYFGASMAFISAMLLLLFRKQFYSPKI